MEKGRDREKEKEIEKTGLAIAQSPLLVCRFL